jgi:hypothetical protein
MNSCRRPFAAALAGLGLFALTSAANADNVAILGVNGASAHTNMVTFLTGNGHTATAFGQATPASLAGFDAVVLLRYSGGAFPNAAISTMVQNFVLAGGELITEAYEAEWAVDVANLLVADDAGTDTLVGAGTPVTFTPVGLASGMGDGLPNPYSDGGRTEYFRTFSNIGPLTEVLGTRPGDLPAILGGQSGLGTTVVIGYDWADGFPAGASNSGQLLLNALDYAPGALNVPEPGTMTLFALGALFAVRRGKALRRRHDA